MFRIPSRAPIIKRIYILTVITRAVLRRRIPHTAFDDIILITLVLPAAVAVAGLIFRIPQRLALDGPFPAH